MNRLIASLAVLTFASNSYAASAGAAFLKIDPSARSYALGQSGVVSALGAQAIGVNPANLMSLGRKMELLTSYSSLTEGVSYGHIAGAINRSLNKDLLVDAIGFSYTRLSVTGLEGRDSLGNRTGDFGSADSQMSLSLSGNAGKVRLGVTGKIVQSKIATYKANTAMAMDAGMSYSFRSFGKVMNLGASISNMGQDIKFIDQKDALPTSLNLGLTTQVGILNLMGGVRQQVMGKSETTMNLGMEFNLGMVSLRAGMNALGNSGGNKTSGTAGLMEGLSSGIGLRLGVARMDYAIGQESADLGISHRLSLTLQFGRRAE